MPDNVSRLAGQAVFLRSELSLTLPSDSQSPTTPLLLANGWKLQSPITDLHRQVIRHARRTTKNLLLLQTGGGGYLIYLVWVFSFDTLRYSGTDA